MKKCYQANVDRKLESVNTQKKISKVKMKINNLIDLRTEGDISTEEYRNRRKKLDEELAGYEEELKEQNLVAEIKPEDGLKWDKIRATLEELVDFSQPKIDNSIIGKFIAKIIPQGNNRFAWFVNLSSLKTEEIDMAVEGRKTNPTVNIKKKDNEETEDDESSIHSNMLFLRDIVLALQGEKYSPVSIPHRLLLQVGRRLLSL